MAETIRSFTVYIQKNVQIYMEYITYIYKSSIQNIHKLAKSQIL